MFSLPITDYGSWIITMFISLSTLAIIVLFTFMLGMLTAFVMALKALARMKN